MEIKQRKKQNKNESVKLNLSEWAIILYLRINPNSKRRTMAKDFNIEGDWIGHIIRKLKDKKIITAKRDSKRLTDVYYNLK